VEQRYFRWRREYGALLVDQAKRLKELPPSKQRMLPEIRQRIENSVIESWTRRDFEPIFEVKRAAVQLLRASESSLE
jgi:hypothetical protein